MKKKKPIQEKPDISIKGLRVRCAHCNTWVASCGETKKDLSTCPHKEQLSYLAVVHVPNTKHGRVIRELGTDLNAAVIKLAKLREEVLSGKVQEKKKGKTPTIIPPAPAPLTPPLGQKNTGDSIPLVIAMSKYIGFLNNVDVPKHKQRDRSEGYKKDIARAFKYFCGCLKKKGYTINEFLLSSLSDAEVGIFYEHLTEERRSSPFTFNRYMTYFTSFLDWCNKQGFPVKNVFSEVEREDTETDSRSISREHFEQLLQIVTRENGVQYFPGKKKEQRNVFRDYLKSAYRIGLLTGRRTEECISIRFSDIDDDCKTICVEDFKPNRIRNRKGTQRKFFYIPVTPQLRMLIDTLGYAEYKGTDRYLLAPDIIENRVSSISDILSRSFSHYYDQLGTGEKRTWKCLRKTYLSRLQIYLQQNASKISVKDISNHSDDAVLENHYFDKQLIAAALADSGFEVFPSRAQELSLARTDGNKKTHEPKLEL